MSKTLRDELLDVIIMERFGEDIKLLQDNIVKVSEEKSNEYLNFANSLPSEITRSELYKYSDKLESIGYKAEAKPLDLSYDTLRELTLIKSTREIPINSLINFIDSLKQG